MLASLTKRWPQRNVIARTGVLNVCLPDAGTEIMANLLILNGERGGARTHDPVIKSHVLYRLSYALAAGSIA